MSLRLGFLVRRALRSHNPVRRRLKGPLGRLTSLEARILPAATRVWDGGAVLNDKWTNANNWEGNVAPIAGDDLVFPTGVGVLDRSTNNDFPLGTTFGSITLEGDYKLDGNRIALKTGANITASGNGTFDGRNEILLDIRWNSGEHFITTDDTPLDFAGVLSNSGAGSLRYDSGGGEIRFLGDGSNTYNQTVFLETGNFGAEKSGSADSFAGPLIIGNAGKPRALLQVSSGGELKAGIAVTVRGALDGQSDLQLEGSAQESIGSLSLQNGRVFGATSSVLKVGGTIQSALAVNNISFLILDLGSNSREINTIGTLSISAQITNGGIRKLGSGALFVAPFAAPNTFAGGITVENGNLNLGAAPGLSAMQNGTLLINDGRVVVNSVDALGDSVSVTVEDNGEFSANFTGIEKLQSLRVLGGNAELINMTRIDLSGVLFMQNDGFLRLESDLVVSLGSTIDSSLLLASGHDALFLAGLTLRQADLRFDDLNVDKFLTTQAADVESKLFGDFGVRRTAPSLSPFKFDIADGPALQDFVITGGIFDTIVAQDLLKAGAGRMDINGVSTFERTMTVSQGTLIVNGLHQLGQYVVSGGTLGGNGQVNTVTANTNGVVSPGLSPGEFRTQKLNLNAGSRLLIELNGLNPGEFDTIDGGDVKLVGNPTLDVRVNFNVSLGDTFEIVTGITDQGVSGRFKDVAGNVLEEGSTFLVDGLTFVISYVANNGTAIAITRGNSLPAFVNRKVNSPFEGQLAVVSGRITEPNPGDTFFLDVDWGDGNPVETFEFPPGTPPNISVTHRYVNDGQYSAHLVWRDEHGGSNEATMSIVVKNAPPKLVLNPVGPLSAGAQFFLTGVIQDLGTADVHRVTIDWGDGTISEIDFAAGEPFVAGHTYTARGRYRVKLSIQDSDGATTTQRVTLNVGSTIAT